MADKLSERLEAAVERLYEDGMDTRDIADLFREAAELARRVEAAPVADIREDGGESALLSAATRAGYYQGQRVRIVPEDGQGGW